MHAEQVQDMLRSGELDEDKPEETERKLAEMEGITAEILGELDQDELEDGEDKVGEKELKQLYRQVTIHSQHYRNQLDFTEPDDHGSLSKQDQLRQLSSGARAPAQRLAAHTERGP